VDVFVVINNRNMESVSKCAFGCHKSTPPQTREQSEATKQINGGLPSVFAAFEGHSAHLINTTSLL
jgi:hypothetical protein